MIITEIYMKNFAIFKDKRITLDKDTKVFAVIGNNGEGKTTILRAIELVFGSKDRSYEDFLPFDGSSDSFTVEIKGMYKEKEIKIGLTYKGAGKRYLEYNGEKLEGQDVQRFLNDHFDSDILNRTNFSTSSFNVTESTPTELRQYLEKLLNIDYKQKLDDLKSEKKDNETQVIRSEAELDLILNKKYEEIVVEEPNFPEEDLENDKEKLRVVMNKLSHFSKKENLDKEHIRLESEIQKLEEDINDISKQILDEEGIKAIDIERTASEANIARYDDEISKLTISKGESQASIKTYKNELESFEKQLDGLRHISECPTCFQQVDINHREFLRTFFDKEIASRKELIYREDTKIFDISTEIERCEEMKRSYMRALTSCQKIKELHLQSKRDKEGKEALLKSKMDQSNLVLNEIKDLDINEVSYADLSFEKDNLINNIEHMEGLWNNFRLNQKLKLDQDESKRKDSKGVELLKTRVKTLKKDISVINTTIDLLSKRLPIKIMNEALKKVTSRMNRFINNVYDKGIEVKFEERGGGIVLLYSMHDTFINSNNASGYEKQLINLIFRVVSSLLSKLDILFLDEPDSNASEESSESLFDGLIDYLMSYDKIDQLFYITHRPTVLEKLESIEGSQTLYLKG